MEQKALEEEFSELIKLEGEIRGVAIKSDLDFILKEEGKEGLKKLEYTITKFSYPIKREEVSTMDFYPLGLEAITFVAIKRLFDWDDKKFQEMGSSEAKRSLVIRLFMRYFYSIERFSKEVPKIWREYFTVGDLEVRELNREEKYVILRLENFRCHQLHCQSLMGYFHTIVQMIIGSKASCEETKCLHRGDKYHEFLLKW